MTLSYKLELFNEINRNLLEEKRPSEYLNKVSKDDMFKEYPFNLLNKLKDTKQSPKYHPEGSVWNHTMLVLDNAAKIKEKSKDKRVFMWAALLHDIGKPLTTRVRKGRITSYDHDKEGEKITKEFLNQFEEDEDFINSVSSLVRWHMQILFVVNDMPFADIESMKSQVNIDEVALLGLCDRTGRGGYNQKEEEENIERFILKCNLYK